MDPSMLLGFLIRDEADYNDWKAAVEVTPPTRIVHVYKEEPSLSGDAVDADFERAVLDVQSCDEDEEEDNALN